MRLLFVIEAVFLPLPAILFLGFTLREVVWATSTVLKLRASNPEVGLAQAYSGVALWLAGLLAVGVLVTLVVATARAQVFRFGAVFWLGVLCAIACTALMYGPFGATATFIVAVPPAILALHAAYVQRQLRSVA